MKQKLRINVANESPKEGIVASKKKKITVKTDRQVYF